MKEISIFEILEQESLWNGHVKIIGYQFVTKFKLVFCAKYNRAIRGLDLGFCEILKPLKWTNITSFFLIWSKRSTNFYYFSVNLNKNTVLYLYHRHLILVKKIYLDTGIYSI